MNTTIDACVGNTPLLALETYSRYMKLDGVLIGKYEAKNPSGSVKDRIAKAMLDDAQQSGRLIRESVIIEPTSGNTGIALASLAAARGHRIILTLPQTISAERRILLGAYGAELVLTEASRGMQGAIDKALELAARIEHSFVPGQFENPSNPKAHYETTGPEIWRDTGGAVDLFVAGVGTGGTISGVGRYLKEKNPDVRIVAAEPARSPVLSGGRPGRHRIQGIGAGFVPKILETGVIDEVITVENEDAFMAARSLARADGVLAGISSGAALWAAAQIAKRKENREKCIVVLLPDSGERYLSTRLFLT